MKQKAPNLSMHGTLTVLVAIVNEAYITRRCMPKGSMDSVRIYMYIYMTQFFCAKNLSITISALLLHLVLSLICCLCYLLRNHGKQRKKVPCPFYIATLAFSLQCLMSIQMHAQVIGVYSSFICAVLLMNAQELF